ncbi:hypothetical protein BJ875DRAFT_370567 [Amylocarpus encephaloides]|uniref:Uncharacterized protein n=1 Tax=Amylocarpus encephaloides TaxID=45428 RepID=A0A9P7YNM2_9HELO|nr:hypothetical protein BJ875DRAFT_370567 [Amylocarpus encephaloides]
MNAGKRAVSSIFRHRSTLESCAVTKTQYRSKYVPARRAPKIHLAVQRGSVVPPKTTQDDLEEYLPPILLLEMSKKAGAIDIEAKEAMEFLRSFHQSSQNPKDGWEDKVCQDHKVSPATLAILAGILNRGRSIKQQRLARDVLVSAANLGEKSAIVELVLAGIKTGINKPVFRGPLRWIRLLAEIENDPEAMMILGKVLLSQKKTQEALQWFQKSTQQSNDFNGAGDAYVNQGVILSSMGRKPEAETTFRKAALELDHPEGYLHMSKLQAPGSSDQKVYLLKAASSGIIEACHNLGALELSEFAKRDEKPKSILDYGMAWEWTNIAATAGFGPSVLNLALMHKEVGNTDAALQLLAKAESDPAIKPEASKLKREWL